MARKSKILLTLAIFLIASDSFAEDSARRDYAKEAAYRNITYVPYNFSGVFSWGEVISTLCGNGVCRLSLPSDFYNLNAPFAVYEKDFESCFSVLQNLAKSNGWSLSIDKKRYVRATKIENKHVSYVSCLDTLVHSVPNDQLAHHLKSDSIRCYVRSLKLPTLSYSGNPESYRVSFYMVTSSSLENLGFNWSDAFLSGDLRNYPSMIESWTLYAVASGDSTAEFRTIDIVLDTAATIHWGSQIKEAESVVATGDYVTTNYEWRDYGLTLKMKRDSLLRVDFTLAQSDESNSVLEGSMIGVDSLMSWGSFTSSNVSFQRVPFFSRIPLIGRLFTYEETGSSLSFFMIDVVPSDSRPYRYSRDSSIVMDTIDVDFFLQSSSKEN